MVYVWKSEWFLRYKDFYEIKGVGHGPRESLAGVTGCVLA